MADATFEVRDRARRRGPLDRFGAAGADAVEFLIGAQPGRRRRAAARDRLGRRAVARDARADERRDRREGSATVVFDEVDAGVGGATARAVGERLRALADGRQVLCITHLPQVASLAAAPFPRRQARAAARRGAPRAVARAEVERLGRAELVEELCRMLGADAGDEAARRHAEKLLQAA